MTAEELVDSLKETVKTYFGIPAVLLPQKATINSARIELLFQSVIPNGEGNEKLTFTADFRTNGTHKKWLTETISFSRKVQELSKEYMPLNVDGVQLRCYWIKNGAAGWRYPSEEESSMPAEYENSWRVELDIPSRLFLED